MADEVLDDMKYVAIQTINFWNNNIVPKKEPNLNYRYRLKKAR